MQKIKMILIIIGLLSGNIFANTQAVIDCAKKEGPLKDIFTLEGTVFGFDCPKGASKVFGDITPIQQYFLIDSENSVYYLYGSMIKSTSIEYRANTNQELNSYNNLMCAGEPFDNPDVQRKKFDAVKSILLEAKCSLIEPKVVVVNIAKEILPEPETVSQGDNIDKSKSMARTGSLSSNNLENVVAEPKIAEKVNEKENSNINITIAPKEESVATSAVTTTESNKEMSVEQNNILTSKNVNEGAAARTENTAVINETPQAIINKQASTNLNTTIPEQAKEVDSTGITTQDSGVVTESSKDIVEKKPEKIDLPRIFRVLIDKESGYFNLYYGDTKLAEASHLVGCEAEINGVRKCHVVNESQCYEGSFSSETGKIVSDWESRPKCGGSRKFIKKVIVMCRKLDPKLRMSTIRQCQ